MQLAHWPLWEPKSNAPGTEDSAAIWPAHRPRRQSCGLCGAGVQHCSPALSGPTCALEDPLHFTCRQAFGSRTASLGCRRSELLENKTEEGKRKITRKGFFFFKWQKNVQAGKREIRRNQR